MTLQKRRNSFNESKKFLFFFVSFFFRSRLWVCYFLVAKFWIHRMWCQPKKKQRKMIEKEKGKWRKGCDSVVWCKWQTKRRMEHKKKREAERKERKFIMQWKRMENSFNRLKVVPLDFTSFIPCFFYAFLMPVRIFRFENGKRMNKFDFDAFEQWASVRSMHRHTQTHINSTN